MSKPINKDTLNDLGVFILEGMTEHEACVLSNINWNELQLAKEKSDVVRDFIEKKNTEFKHNHLKEIQKNKSEKNSQWLLEKLRPEEFGSRPKGGGGDTQINIISAIIKDIQNEDEGIIRINRGSRGIESNENDSRITVAEVLG